jgi:UDP-2-acetamido-3-amino-2,3-dideoxy-glucuronate N-acetyltransferase
MTEMNSPSCLSLALIGAGNWGRNLARNFYKHGVLHSICDTNESTLYSYAALYRNVKLTAQFDSILSNPSISKVAIATPLSSHYYLAKQALLSGKDVFVEKPLCLDKEQAMELAEIAAKKQLILMVGHIMQYHPYINFIQHIIEERELGDLIEIVAERFIPVCKHKDDILWDLAPHDISLFLSFTSNTLPTAIQCKHAICTSKGILNEAFLKLQFPSNCQQASIFISRLKPIKKQKLTIIGSKATLIFDDAKPWEKKLLIQQGETSYFRYVPHEEPLTRECAHFIECCKNRAKPKTHVQEALNVILILQTAQKRIREKILRERSEKMSPLSINMQNVVLENVS